MSNLFAGVRNAKTSERGAFCKPGKYTVKIKRCLNKHTRKGYDAFIVEFEIETSNYVNAKADAVRAMGDKPYDAKALEDLLPNPEGSTASWFQSLADTDIGFGALKGFAANLLGVKPEDPEFLDNVEGFLSEAVSDNALAGTVCPLEVITIKTKKGGDFSLYKFGEMFPQPST
jgi:hypothetical protein